MTNICKQLHLSLDTLDLELINRLRDLDRHVDRQGRSSLAQADQVLWYAGRVIRQMAKRIREMDTPDEVTRTLARRAEENEIAYLEAALTLDGVYTICEAAGLKLRDASALGEFLRGRLLAQ